MRFRAYLNKLAAEFMAALKPAEPEQESVYSRRGLTFLGVPEPRAIRIDLAASECESPARAARAASRTTATHQDRPPVDWRSVQEARRRGLL